MPRTVHIRGSAVDVRCYHPGMRHLVLAACLAFTTQAQAQEQFDERDDRDLPTYHSRTLPPGDVDVALGLGADVLIRDVLARAHLDVGVLSLGVTTLGLGLELSGGQCVNGCLRDGAARIETTHALGLLRASWHFPLSAPSSNVESTDVYALAFGGAAWIRHQGGAVHGRSLAPAFGVGLGSLHFPGGGNTLFAAGELRVLWAQTVTPVQGGTLSYGLGGFAITFSVGARL